MSNTLENVKDGLLNGQAVSLDAFGKAVSESHPQDAIKAARRKGLKDLSEDFDQELYCALVTAKNELGLHKPAEQGGLTIKGDFKVVNGSVVERALEMIAKSVETRPSYLRDTLPSDDPQWTAQMAVNRKILAARAAELMKELDLPKPGEGAARKPSTLEDFEKSKLGPN